MSGKPLLAIFDMSMTENSPAGSCVLAEVRGLREHYRVLIISADLQPDMQEDNAIEWLKITLPKKPILLRYVLFHLLAPIVFLKWKRLHGNPDLVQATQGQFASADIAYAHFCHRAYLKTQWPKSTVKGIRRLARWMNHKLNAFFEARAFRRCKKLVVPSLGLARDLTSEYPEVSEKIHVIANPVALEKFSRPEDFDRLSYRQQLGIETTDVVISFMALGDFSRKGLGLLIEAMGQLSPAQRQSLKLLVIGGQAGEIEQFRDIGSSCHISEQLIFVGMQKQVAPYLWASDIFALPSTYEIFSLAILQAAASGLPTMVTKGLYGAEEFVVDGINGWQVPRDVESIKTWLEQLTNHTIDLPQMKTAAVASVQQYSGTAFVKKWSSLYDSILT